MALGPETGAAQTPTDTAAAARAAAGGKPRAIRIAVLAMGGEGGGVLADWIVSMGEHEGYLAQTTSVPGVAQRTGATIYYIELFPKAAIPSGGPNPVLALMPVPGDVDVVVCSELMEAGRAIQRGIVTPDRTTLVTSTHRVYSMTERTAMADGRVDAPALLDACHKAAKHIVALDMAGIAERTGSVVSAAMFGALARSGALPFDRKAFEATIERGGVGVAPSLRCFAAAFGEPVPEAAGEVAALPPQTLDGRDAGTPNPPAPALVQAQGTDLAALVAEVGRKDRFPEAARAILREGVLRAADYQDAPYARRYLDRLRPVLELDRASPEKEGRLLAETARELALGMAYEDTIRVAELKTRPERFDRVRKEVRAGEDQVLEIAEFMHPRVQEIAETLPAAWGRWLLRTGWANRLLGRFAHKGRVVKTSSLSGFLLLYAVASLKPLRPRSLRWEEEQRFLDAWLARVAEAARRGAYDLAVEIALTRTLVKGYGDTHARGKANYEAIMAALPAIEAGAEPAATLAALRKAALADDTGAALRGALAPLSGPPSLAGVAEVQRAA